MPTSFGVAKTFRSGEFRDPAVTYVDFFVFNFIMTAGSDLDIRANLLNPTGVNETIGWGRDNTMRHNVTFAYWEGTILVVVEKLFILIGHNFYRHFLCNIF